MAARAHVVHNYSLPFPRARARRQVLDRNDPVVIPRSSVWSAGAGLVAAAVAIGAIVSASAFAGFYTAPPGLSETPALPMLDRWQPDSLVGQANVTNLLAGPSRAVPSLDGPNNAGRLDEEPFFAQPGPGASSPPSPAELSPEMSSEPPLPGTRTLPYPGPPITTPALPYPNPTTTPPDAVAPSDAAPETPSPAVDPENPYRE